MATSETQPKAAPDKSAAEYQQGGQKAADRATGSDKSSARGVKSETTARTASGESVRAARSGNRGEDPNGGLGDELRETHEARVSVPGAPNVDARLDNRRGADRPKLEEWPAKPQQIDGPDVIHQAEFTRKVLEGRDNEVDMSERKGMFSPGPHGLSDENLREGDTTYGTEGVGADEAGGKPSAA